MNSNQVCNEHKETIIAIEFNLDSQKDFIQMCSVCVTERTTQENPKGKVLTLNMAYQCIEDIKEEFKQNQAKKVNNIKNALNGLKNEIQGIQTKVKQICDKLLENIEQELENASQSLTKLDKQLKESLILSPTELKNQLKTIEQEFDYSKQSQLFNELIEQLNIDDQIKNSHKIIKQEEINDDTTLNSIQEKFQLKPTKTNRTPHLSLVCEEHHTEIVYLDLSKNSKRSNRLCCLYCQYNSQGQFTPVKDVFERWETYVKDVHDVVKYVNQFYGSKESSIILSFDKFISYLQETKSQFQEKFNQFLKVVISQKVEYYREQNKIKSLQSYSTDEVIQICSKLIHQYTSQQIKQQLLDDFAEIDNEIINFLQNQIMVPLVENTVKVKENLCNNATPIDEAKKPIQMLKKESEQKIQNEEITQKIYCQISNQKSLGTQTEFQYNVIMQIEEKEDCWCMLFDKDETLLVTCHDSKNIKIYEIAEKNLKLIQVLKGQTQSLFAIQIHNITKQIITSDKDTLIVWNYQQENKQWIQGQILEGHSDSINCLISNQEETMLISGGDDTKINYWCKQQDMIWTFQGSIDIHKSKILSLSITQRQDLLISSEYNNNLSICKWQEQKQWLNIQEIKLDSRSWRITFITNNLFVIQQENGKLTTFKQQNSNSEFHLFQYIKISDQQNCQFWFPLIYNNKKQLLLNKHHHSLYLMREQNDTFTLELTFCFKNKNFWGTLSNNAQYLATWDDQSREIQIRKQI